MQDFAKTVFFDQSAKPFADAIASLEGINPKEVMAIKGETILAGNPIEGKGAIGYPTDVENIPNSRIIVVSSVIKCSIKETVKEMVETDGTIKNATIKIFGAPMNSNSDWIWNLLAMHYLNQKKTVFAYQIKLAKEVETFAGNNPGEKYFTYVTGGMEVSARAMKDLANANAKLALAGI